MKNYKYSALGLLLTLSLSWVLVGCVSEPVKIEWPANHPANPESQEAEFIPPQNPFHTDMAVMKEAPEKNSMMNHKMPKEDGMQHMDHKMGTDKKRHSDSESQMKPEHTDDHNQHQEHSQ